MSTTPAIWKDAAAIGRGVVHVVTFDNGNYATITEYGGPTGQLYDPLGAAIGKDFLQGSFSSGYVYVEDLELRTLPGGKLVVGYTEQNPVSEDNFFEFSLPKVTLIDAGAAKSSYIFEGDYNVDDRLLAIDTNSSNNVAILYEHDDGFNPVSHHLVVQTLEGKEIFHQTIDLGSGYLETRPVLAEMPDGRIVIAWQKFDSSLKTYEDSISIFNSDGTFVDKIQSDANFDGDHLATVVDDDHVLLSWGSEKGLQYKIIDASGNDVGKTYTVENATSFSHKVAKLNGGGFVIAWKSESPQGDSALDGTLNVRTFDATGEPTGDTYEIKTSADDRQPDMSVTSDDRIVVTYSPVKPGPDHENAIVILDPRDELIEGSDQADTIAARRDVTTVKSYGGNDTLYGIGAKDTLIGGDGNDTYIIDAAVHRIVETGKGGIDTVQSTVSYTLAAEVENLLLTGAGNIDATGNGLANSLTGNSGANILDGKAGADTMAGGRGNDIYLVDNAGDLVFEKVGEGSDTIRTSVSYALAAGQEVETLELAAGTAALNLTGNALANTLRDNAGNNRLDGGAGADILVSSGGKDVLIGGQGSDSALIDRSGAKVALSFVMQSVNGTTTLKGDGTTTTSIGNITLTGGSGNDTFTTLDGTDTLNGGAGNDTLNGGGGADRLIGGIGNDSFIVDNAGDRVVEAANGGTDRVFSSVSYALAAGQEIEALQLLASTGSAKLNLVGNAFGQSLVGNAGANVLDGKLGADALTGGRGADTFVFSTALGTGNVDRIADFAVEDTIRLSKSIFTALAPGQLAAGAFKNLGTGKVDADDHILYKQATGELFYDADGSGKAAAVKFAVIDTKVALTHADFFVV